MSRKGNSTSISPLSATQFNGDLFNHRMEYQLDTKVLQFQNSKLVQKLEAQKAECIALENKFSQLRDKQLPYDNTLTEVNKTWEKVVDDLETRSTRMKDSTGLGLDAKTKSADKGGALSSVEDAFLSRLLETGATECSSVSNIPNQIDEDRRTAAERTKKILCNIVDAINGLCSLKDGLYAAALKELPEDGSCRQNKTGDLEKEVKNLRLVISDLHLKHRSLAREMQSHRDTDAKNKADLKRLRGELESTIAELDESNCKLATLKAQRDAAKGAFFPVLVGNKHVSSDRARDKQKILQDMESVLKELLDQSSLRLLELKRHYEEIIELLKQLADLQNNMKNVKCISSSQAYILVKDQLAKAKAAVVQYQALFEKLQPAIYVTSLAAVEVLRARDGGQQIIDSVDVTCGLSLGEYTALAFAGAFSFEDGLKLVKLRGQAMQEAADAAKSAMVSVIGLDSQKVQLLCDAANEEVDEANKVQIANFLCPGNYAVSGGVKGVEALEAKAKSFKARMTVRLAVAGAFHTSFMDPAVSRLEAALAATEIRIPRIPVISNVDAQPHADPETIKKILARQVTSPVQWETTVKTLLTKGLKKSYELGPGKVIAGIVKRMDRGAEIENISA